MKKLIGFLRSMKFGMLLLVLVILCSLAGSLIVQQRDSMEYVTRYGESAARVILFLGLDDVFSTPYFFGLMAALCLNLTLCSVARLPRIAKSGAALVARAGSAEMDFALLPGQAQALCAQLSRHGFRRREGEGRAIWTRHLFGVYGSFFVHLSFLLILAVGTAAVMTAEVTDTTVMPGETITLGNGARVTVEAFHIEDESGRLDYASQLSAVSADGAREAQKVIRVNEPLSFEGYKLYQQTYGTAGSVRIERISSGESDVLTLTEPCMLTLDGHEGLFYQAVYPGYIRDEDGSITLITSSSGAYADPVYDVLSMAQGEVTPVLAFPGESITIGDVRFTMMDPVSYPGLRIKHVYPALLGLLYAVFGLMVAALVLCFFMPPAAVAVAEDGYTVVCPKARDGLLAEIGTWLSEGE